MRSPPGIPLYNQDRLSDADFVDNFVARGELVEALLADLGTQAERDESRHTLIVGPRGMGKSSLLRRISIGVSSNQRLHQKFIPLRFREEQYNVITLDAFWRNCGEALAEWCENDGRGELATKLDSAIASLRWRDAEQAAAAFLAACREFGRRAILLIDNLDIVVDALAEQECWALRNILQRKGGPIIFGAATSLLRQGGDRSAPFYEFFFPYVLEPLSETELMRCMRALAEKRGEPGEAVTTILAREPQRVRALFALTGGNPRVLALIYQLLERAESQEILADLETLLDGVTPYYKARIEEYGATQQRAVIDAIALNWDPMTSNAIGQVTGVEVTTISSQLAKLKKDGFIEEVATSGARAGYQISERFLNIWYLMRHGTRRVRQRLRWLTLFLTKLFSPEELGAMLEEADGEKGAGRWRADWRIAVREAYDLACAPGRGRDPALSEVVGSLEQAVETGVRTSEELGDEGLAEVLVRKIKNFAKLLGKPSPTELIAECDELLSISEGSKNLSDRALAAIAFAKSTALYQLGHYSASLVSVSDAIKRSGEANEPGLPTFAALMLDLKYELLRRFGRNDEAIVACDEVLASFGDSAEPELQEDIARALVNKGVALHALGRNDDAIAVYDEVIARFSASAKAELQEGIARALLNKAFALRALGRNDDAIAAYDNIVARFEGSVEADLQLGIARALVNKGVALHALGRNDEALAVYDDVLARFSASAEAELQEGIARALVNKGGTLRDLGRNDEAIAVCDDVIERFGASTEVELREGIARALVNKVVALHGLGRNDEAIAVCDDVIERFSASTEVELQKCVAEALADKSLALGEIGRNNDSFTTYNDLLARFGASSELETRELVGRVLTVKGIQLLALGRNDEAIAVFDDVVLRLGNSVEPTSQEGVAVALVSKGQALRALGRNDDAIAAWGEVIARFEASERVALRERVGHALISKGGLLLDQRGDATGAEVCYLKALRFEDLPIIAKANLPWALLTVGRVAEAEALRADLAGLDAAGRALLDAAIEFVRDNFGIAVEYLAQVLKDGLEDGQSPFFEDLLRLLRLAEAKGYGERLIAWFETTGYADRYAPVFAALVAFVRGERFLLDVNPEVRAPARKLFDQLAAPRKYAAPKTVEPGRRGRGRPRKEGGGRR